MNMSLSVPDDPAYATFKELDQQHGLPKGSTFRAFKRLLANWTEGVEFICCDVRCDPVAFARLLESGRLYAGTVNAVLIAPAGIGALTAALGSGED